jgi:hypothetical protein
MNLGQFERRGGAFGADFRSIAGSRGSTRFEHRTSLAWLV